MAKRAQTSKGAEHERPTKRQGRVGAELVLSRPVSQSRLLNPGHRTAGMVSLQLMVPPEVRNELREMADMRGQSLRRVVLDLFKKAGISVPERRRWKD